MKKLSKIKTIDVILLTGICLGLILIVLPYSVYKQIGDSLATDGEMERLTASVVFGMRLVLAGVILAVFGILLWGLINADSRKRFFVSLRKIPSRFIHDFKPFFHDLLLAMKPFGVTFWQILLIFAAGVVVRLLQINTPLMHDEAYSMAIWGRSDLKFAISDYHLPNNHVFHSVLVNLIYHHIGNSVPLLRLPVFLAGCFLIPAVWLLANMFYNRTVGLIAAGFVAFAPFLISYSVNARGYEIQALFSVVTVGLAVYVKRKRNIFAWILLIILSALNFFTLPIALYPFGGICVWLFFNVISFHSDNNGYRSRWQLLKYLIFMGLSVSALSMLLYVPLLRFSGWDSFFGNIYIGGTEASTFNQTLLSRLYDNVSAFTGNWPKPVVWIIAAGLIGSLFVFRRRTKEKVPFLLVLILWIGILIPFQRPNLWPRTLLFLHPFLLITAASGISGLGLIPGMKKASPFLYGALILWAGISQVQTSVPESLDERAIKIILEREQENSGNIHLVTAAQDNAPLWIYADSYGLPRKIFDKREGFNMIYAFVNPNNDSYRGPKELEDLLARFGPGGNFINRGSEEILMNEADGILYRFEGVESAIRKGYGEFPEIP